jgi:hypothetical protein
MPYEVTRDENGVPHLTLSDEPAYCHALAANVTKPEQTGAGQWLLMAFAAWSAPDVAAVQAALDLAHSLGGKLNLGLLPYDDPYELREWYSGITPEANGPYWIVLRDGAACQCLTGIFTADELRKAISL